MHHSQLDKTDSRVAQQANNVSESFWMPKTLQNAPEYSKFLQSAPMSSKMLQYDLEFSVQHGLMHHSTFMPISYRYAE